MATHMRTELVIDALKMVVAAHGGSPSDHQRCPDLCGPGTAGGSMPARIGRQ
ncbi:hypothetical protein [Streptomyces sp. IMTB 2501]|uniref:hypothetical protein n=1 Tax=Streptomyces sp. IMTB 2501 TaxID=1776340 RepID=UPI0015C12B48|nr:hypothetical protein [Streptomyces sp. IMTB 2501]